MSRALAHRGPDGEGFLFATAGAAVPCFGEYSIKGNEELPYFPHTHVDAAPAEPFLAMGHRRLTVIDLSEAGHQPMCDRTGKYWINYNGEVYNYRELRTELESAGHRFYSSSDTEVVLRSYIEWGERCVDRFNGMWAFCIYDREHNSLFLSRDRLGVKPLYYLNTKDLFAFASEQKAFVRSGLIGAEASEEAVHAYLVNDLLEFSENNFFSGVNELWPGYYMKYDLESGEIRMTKYFGPELLVSNDNKDTVEKDLLAKIRESLATTVRLRMRSDVDTGVCLSGGIDSSVLTMLMSEIHESPLKCFTASFAGYKFDETHYAATVAEAARAKHFLVNPEYEGFISELDTLIYALDVPIWDSSTYAQYKVMWLAKQNGVKVVLDGQGADELFAGYHHHFIAEWNGLFRSGRWIRLLKEISSAGKSIPSPFLFFMKQSLKAGIGNGNSWLPKLFRKEFLESFPALNQARYADSVNAQLLEDMGPRRLKSFLRCEDRCGMWHSVESRVPFSDDVHLLRLMFSFDGSRKIRNGISKHLLRESVKDLLPPPIYTRYDKKGFETPMLEWVNRYRTVMKEEIRNARFNFLKTDLPEQIPGKYLLKLYVLARWKKVFAEDNF
jgi:asparagine synthase (glutamine-hydrolysing)